MTNIDILKEILANLRSKYDKVNELWIYTKDMDAALKSDDDTAFGTVLDARKRTMDAIDIIQSKNKALANRLPISSKDKIISILDAKSVYALDNQIEMDIFDTVKRTSMLFNKLVAYNTEVENLLKTKNNKK